MGLGGGILLNKGSPGKASDKLAFEQGLEKVRPSHSFRELCWEEVFYIPEDSLKVKLGIFRNNEVTAKQMLGMS